MWVVATTATRKPGKKRSNINDFPACGIYLKSVGTQSISDVLCVRLLSQLSTRTLSSLLLGMRIYTRSALLVLWHAYIYVLLFFPVIRMRSRQEQRSKANQPPNQPQLHLTVPVLPVWNPTGYRVKCINAPWKTRTRS